MGTFLGGPINKDYSILGSPYFGKLADGSPKRLDLLWLPADCDLLKYDSRKGVLTV